MPEKRPGQDPTDVVTPFVVQAREALDNNNFAEARRAAARIPPEYRQFAFESALVVSALQQRGNDFKDYINGVVNLQLADLFAINWLNEDVAEESAGFQPWKAPPVLFHRYLTRIEYYRGVLVGGGQNALDQVMTAVDNDEIAALAKVGILSSVMHRHLLAPGGKYAIEENPVYEQEARTYEQLADYFTQKLGQTYP